MHLYAYTRTGTPQTVVEWKQQFLIVTAAGERAWVEAIVLRDEPGRDASDAEIAAIPGATTPEDELPLAPTRAFARPLLGTVGDASAEQVEASGGDLKAGDRVGLSGLQAAHQDTLGGTPGTTITRHGGDARRRERLGAGTELRLRGELLGRVLGDALRLADLGGDDRENSGGVVHRPPNDGLGRLVLGRKGARVVQPP